jgi:hypothetical protein
LLNLFFGDLHHPYLAPPVDQGVVFGAQNNLVAPIIPVSQIPLKVQQILNVALDEVMDSELFLRSAPRILAFEVRVEKRKLSSRLFDMVQHTQRFREIKFPDTTNQLFMPGKKFLELFVLDFHFQINKQKWALPRTRRERPWYT